MADYTLSAKITGDASSLEKAFSSAQKSLDSLGKNMESVGKSLMPVTAAIGGVGVATGKMALDFQDSMANINTLLDDTTNLKGYEDAVKRLSNETGMSVDTMSQGMYQAISSLGDNGKETEKIFTTMSKSAKAGGAEVADSVALISAGMKGYNSVNDETAQKISDLAFQTAKLGVTTFPEMAKSMQPLFPLSNSLNVSYEELFGSMATLTGVTGNTAEVSTQLKAILGGLMTPTSEMGKLLDKYGYSNGAAMIEAEGLAGTLKILQTETGGQSDKLAQLFGSQEAIVAMTALTGSQFDTFNDKLAQMQDATGATQTAYDKMSTSGDELRVAFNKIKNTGLELGTTLIDIVAPAITSMADKVDKAANWFTNLDDSQRKTIITIAGVVAAIGPLLIGFGKITSGASSIIGLVSKFGALFSPVTLIVGAIAALAAGFVYLMHTNQAFHDKVTQVWDAVKAKIAGVVNGFSFDGIFSGLQAAFQKISPIVSTVIEGIQGAIQNMIPVFSSIFTAISSVVGNVVQAIGGFFSGLTNGFSSGISAADGFSSVFMTAIGLVCPPLKMVLLLFKNFAPQIQKLVSTIGSSLVPVFSTLGKTIGGIAVAVIPAIQSALANLIPVIANIISAVTKIISTVLPVVVNLINQLSPFLVQVAQIISQIAAALAPMIAQLIDTLLPVITNIVTVVTNIIQSVFPALIAIFNVIMSVIQTIAPVVMDILSVVISVISNIMSAVSPVVSFIGAVISAIMAVITPIVTFMGNIIAAIVKVIGTIIKTVTGIFSTVYSIISGVFTNVSNFISGVINAVSTVISTLTNIVGSVFNAIYATVSSIMTKVGDFISGIFDGIQTAWNGLTAFVGGVFDGIFTAVSSLVDSIRGFVNEVIGGINGAIGIINKIPGVEIGDIPYLLHGTDDWQGGFARMNEGGRGELTYLPDGTQVIPHDVSMQYAKETARSNVNNSSTLSAETVYKGVYDAIYSLVRNGTLSNGGGESVGYIDGEVLVRFLKDKNKSYKGINGVGMFEV